MVPLRLAAISPAVGLLFHPRPSLPERAAGKPRIQIAAARRPNPTGGSGRAVRLTAACQPFDAAATEGPRLLVHAIEKPNAELLPP